MITAQYFTEDGKLLWQEPYVFRRTYRDGQGFRRNSVDFEVLHSELTAKIYSVWVRFSRPGESR
jgi:hypothetical protein